jgi:hypothetical protein
MPLSSLRRSLTCKLDHKLCWGLLTALLLLLLLVLTVAAAAIGSSSSSRALCQLPPPPPPPGQQDVFGLYVSVQHALLVQVADGGLRF